MTYAVSLAALVLTVAVFFMFASGRFAPFGRGQVILRVVVALPLILSSLGHFFRIGTYASTIPPFFPFPRFLVVVTGALEVAGAIGLWFPVTTRWAATCLALLMIAVFPANVYMANHTIGGLHMPGVTVRTAMQTVYIILLLMAGWGIPMRKQQREQ